jgi:hypothetical protein
MLVTLLEATPGSSTFDRMSERPSMDRVFEFAVKAIIILILVPFLLCLAVQVVAVVLGTLLPWLVAMALIAAVVAGVTAGLTLGGRLRPRGQLPAGELPLAAQRVRRPRGGAR